MLHFPFRQQSPSVARDRGFTLLEVLVATALLGLLAGSAIWTLTQANSYAALSRLRTGAGTAAQNQIDLLLTAGPFNPQNGEIPATLAVGTQVENGVVIYSEPAGADGNNHAVTATRTTTVTKLGTVNLPGGVGATDCYLYNATVVVTYNYRNKNYRVQLNAIRTSDV